MEIVVLSNEDFLYLMELHASPDATMAYFNRRTGRKIDQFIWLGDNSFLVL